MHFHLSCSLIPFSDFLDFASWLVRLVGWLLAVKNPVYITKLNWFELV